MKRSAKKMKKNLTVFASCLVLAGIAGTKPSSAGAPPEVAGPGIELRAVNFNMLSPYAFWPSSGCPDIAHTKTFQSGKLEYINSPEFSDAVRAVANSASEYSPAEIPPDWRVAAENWIEYAKLTPTRESNPPSRTASFQLRGGEELQIPRGKDPCSPELLYLASLEYRKMQEREELTPIFPRVVRAATKDLEEIVTAKRQMAGRFASRAAAIGNKIAEAERNGAGNCFPGEIASAKKELERAFIDARMVRASLPETVSSFDRAERLADSLLMPRRFASSGGGNCQ